VKERRKARKEEGYVTGSLLPINLHEFIVCVEVMFMYSPVTTYCSST
jgi:hypothetical protein